MKLKHKIVGLFLSAIAIALFIYLSDYASDAAVLTPAGIIATLQRDLIFISTLLMLIVVVPVLIMTFAICLRYRASNKSAEYMPEWNHDVLAEAIWWGFPFLIIFVLSVVTYVSTEQLDPYKAFPQSKKPIKIQAVALQWKWLFIYPEEKIASINELQFPVLTPLSFEITADAPMNSFWIPQLAGQIYAMPGMNTKLQVMANQIGDFRGTSANLSGIGFAGMIFNAKAISQNDFEKWVKSANGSEKGLDRKEYHQLSKPSSYVAPALYTLKDDSLYHQILMKYMTHEAHEEWIKSMGREQHGK